MAGVKGRSGGARVGAGRRQASATQRWLTGARHRTVIATAPVTDALTPVEPPANLPEAERAVWAALAPHAEAAKMLTAATAGDFAALCALEVEMAVVLAKRRSEGWTALGLALAKEYRGLVSRVEVKRRAYRLASVGKELVAAEPPQDEWAVFDGPTLVKGA